MDWKIGEIRQVNGEWYQCVEQPKNGRRLFAIFALFMVSAIVNLTNVAALIEMIKNPLSSRNLKRSESLICLKIKSFRSIRYLKLLTFITR